MARQPTSKPELVLVPTDANPIPPMPDAMPSAHTIHADTYLNETKLRLSGFESGIVTLTGEMESRYAEHIDKLEQVKIEYERTTSAMIKAHNAEKSDLLRRIDDMQKGKAMAVAALDAYEAVR